jgi:hypothetical protein
MVPGSNRLPLISPSKKDGDTDPASAPLPSGSGVLSFFPDDGEPGRFEHVFDGRIKL